MSGGCNKVRARSFANSADGWRHLLAWLITQKIQRVHACLESTGRYSLGIACALYEAGHVVSIVNPAQIRDFARTKLGRNKTDGIDASRIREYCELFKPSPWAPPSEAHRRLGELQTIRSGIIAGLTEWKNRKNSGIVDAEAQALADATISHFTSQLGAVDKASGAAGSSGWWLVARRPIARRSPVDPNDPTIHRRRHRCPAQACRHDL